MVATIAAGTSAGYYLAQSEYYLGGSEPSGSWALAAPGFGVCAGATVARDPFEQLHEAIDAKGATLLSNGSGRLDRVPGYDLTFSAPKSVSLLWALGDEKLQDQIEAAQAVAVQAALCVVEDNAATSRRGRNGLRFEAVKLSVAAFQHGEARPIEHSDGKLFADPQLHTHSVILNLARRADGTVGTLDGRRLFAWKMAAGAIYHLALARELQKLGLSVTDIGRNGMFEVAGVDNDLMAYFSARRTEIEVELEAAGLTSGAAPALAGAITKASRSVKQSGTKQDRHGLWRAMAAERGHTPERMIEAARAAGRADHGRSIAMDQECSIEAALGSVPDQLTQTESTFEHRHLVAAVASALVGTGADSTRARDAVAAMIAKGQVVELRTDAIGEKRYSTPEMIQRERAILEISARHVARTGREVDRSLARHLSKQHGLNDEQQEAVRSATEPGALALIEGAAGSGKTTSLRPIVEVHKAAGYRVIGSATAWRIANQLRDELQIEGRATDSWLARENAGTPFLDPATLLIVDEAGQLSSRQMHAILQSVEQAGAKLLLVGDRRQLQPIGAGGALSIVARVVETAHVDQIVRQREEWARQATSDLAAGRTGDAIAAYHERGHVHSYAGGKATVAAMVDRWQKHLGDGDGVTPLLLARTNGQVQEINAKIRERLRAAGALRGPDIGLPVSAASGKHAELKLAIGDEIRFQVRNDRLGVVNGTTGVIIALKVRPEAMPTITAAIEGRQVTFDAAELADETGRIKLAHAYASTIYGAQGLTAERAIVLLDPACNRHDTYVALSRARDQTDIVIDTRLVDADMRAERLLSQRDSAVTPQDDARIEWLASRLSRASFKGTTLDLLPENDGANALRASRCRTLQAEAELV